MNRVEISEGKTNKMVDDEEPEALLRTALELNWVRCKNSEIKTNYHHRGRELGSRAPSDEH